MKQTSQSDRVSWSRALGWALLYASAYFLPLFGKGIVSLVPSAWHYIFFPTLVAAALTCVLFWSVSAWGARCLSPGGRRLGASIALLLLSLIAIKGVFSAADYPWLSLLAGVVGTQAAADRDIQAVLIGLVVLALALYRQRWHATLGRLLASMGYSFLLLALFRWVSFPAAPAPMASSLGHAHASSAPDRRVVWLIFDELDQGELQDGQGQVRAEFPHFGAMAREGLVAERAYPLAKDTSSSIPAMLAEHAIDGVSFTGPADISLKHDGQAERLSEPQSVFGRLPGGPQTASIAGFALPYCELFPSVRNCHAYFPGNAGRWYDGILFFSQSLFALRRWVRNVVSWVPESIWSHFDYSYRASEGIIAHALDDIGKDQYALVYVHVNLPHLPGSYAQKAMGLPQVSAPLAVYRENLKAADTVLGRVMEQIQGGPSAHATLLIVSSDHWLRMQSPLKARPIPMMMWVPGLTSGGKIPGTLSTVHIGALGRDYLSHKLNTQAELVSWWRDKPFYETWLPSSSYEY